MVFRYPLMLCLVAGLVGWSSAAATNVSGPITTDTTWDAAGSPYIVTGDVTVQNNAVLTIDPGVEVLFESNRRLQIGNFFEAGALVADGDSGPGAPAQIVFSSNQAAPAAGDWRSLFFEGQADAANSIVRNVLIEYAGGSVGEAGLHLSHNAGSLTVEDVTIRKSAGYGIRLAGGGFSIDNVSTAETSDLSISIGTSGSIVGSVSNSSLESIRYAGVDPNVSWTNNTFDNWGVTISTVEPEAVGDLLSDSVFNAGVGSPRMKVLRGQVETTATWTTDAGILDFQGSPTVVNGAVLTLSPGMRLEMGLNQTFQVGNPFEMGALVADGNSGPGAPAQIVFSSNQPAPAAGDWCSLFFEGQADAANSIVRNVLIEYAGGGVGEAGLYLSHNAGSLTVEDVTIQKSAGYGIRSAGGGFSIDNVSTAETSDLSISIGSSASIVGSVSNSSLESIQYAGVGPDISWTNNTFDNWGVTTSTVEPEAVGDLLSDSVFNAGVGSPRMKVLGGQVETTATWTTDAGTLDFQGNLSVVKGAVLTLSPGVRLEMGPNQTFQVGSPFEVGALIADGNSGPGAPAQIVFSSNQPTPAAGDWRSLFFEGKADAANSVVRNVLIEYAGGGVGEAGLHLSHNAGSLTVEDVTIQKSAGYGIRSAGGGFSIDNVSTTETSDLSISIGTSGSIVGSISNSVFESVEYTGTNPDVSWTNNTFDNWGSMTSKVEPDVVGDFLDDTTFNPVAGAILEILWGTVSLDATWTANAGPLVVVDGDLSVQGSDGDDAVTTLTLLDGLELRFALNRTLVVGADFGDPGTLVVDGRLGPSSFDTVNLTSALASPSVGDWKGILVRSNGRVEIYEAQIRFADLGLDVDGGTLTALDGLTVNRANVGIEIRGSANVSAPLNRLLFKQCDIGLRSAIDLTIRNSNLIASTFGVENRAPETACIDATDNWWDHASGPSGTAPTLGCETNTPSGLGSAISEGVLFAGFLSDPADDGDAFPPDEDNCDFVANPSQRDGDGDGVGDACDSDPVIRVSTDPLDEPDFDNVQDAVDATMESGTRVLIFPGLTPPYFESVRVDRNQVFHFIGTQSASANGMDPIVIDGGSGPAFRIVNTEPLATAKTTLRNMTLRGFQGVTSVVGTEQRDMIFDQVVNEALDLGGGDHRIDRIEVAPGVSIGAMVSEGAGLTMSRATMNALTNAGVVADGSVSLTNVSISGGNGADGIRVGMNGTLSADYVTIYDNTGIGVDNSQGGSVSSVGKSIVYGNGIADLDTVSCADVSYSNIGVPDCSAGGNNISADPLLDTDYRLTDSSPCLETGPDPSIFDGEPRSDRDGGPRLRDHDGDGMAESDCGAYEKANAALTPGEVTGVRWLDDVFKETLLWDAEPSAIEYHIYRQDVTTLSYSGFATCADGLDPDRTDTQLVDANTPSSGSAFSYLISAEDANGEEGTLGYAAAAERSNFTPCP